MKTEISTFAEKDLFAKHCGIEIMEVGKGYAKVRMPIKQFHLNGVGIVHGGAIFTIADFAFAVASNSHGTVALAINASIAYFKAVSSGVLYAEAREVSLTRRLATYEIVVSHDEEGKIALFQGTVFRKKEKIPSFTTT